MTRYRMSDGTVVETDRATQHWQEDTQWDGNNHISLVTGTQFDHQTLYQTRRGRYYVENTSQWQGRLPSAEWVSLEEATRWLLTNNHDVDDLPEDLAALVDEVLE